MKFALAFLVVALCSSLGTGNPLARVKRHGQQRVKYIYYQSKDKGGYSDGYEGSQADQVQLSKDQAQMFAFLFQGIVCIFKGVEKGPADKKAAAYKFIVENTIRFVETTAASCGMQSANEMFSSEADLRFYIQLKVFSQSGDYSNIGEFENTFNGFLGGLGKGFVGLFEGLGIAIGQAVGMVTGLLGDLGLGVVGGLVDAIAGLAGGALNVVGGLAGGLVDTATGIVGGVLGGGKGGGGLLGGVLGGGKGGGGLLGGILGGGGGGASARGGGGSSGGLLGGILGGGGGGGGGRASARGGGGSSGGLLGGFLG